MSLLKYYNKTDSTTKKGRKRKLEDAEDVDAPPAKKRRPNSDETNGEEEGGGYVSSDSERNKENTTSTTSTNTTTTTTTTSVSKDAGESTTAEKKEKKSGDSEEKKDESEGEEEEEAITYENCEKLIEKSWGEILKNEFTKCYYRTLKNRLKKEENAGTEIFPPVPQVFRAFELCPWDNLKVVILGQDPYHDNGQAEGLCFSVPAGVKKPSSLRNIYKEAKSDVGFKDPGHGSLVHWGEQGVLLLNTCLTVKAHKANSHSKFGWQEFTDNVIRAISRKHDGVVFIFWGKQAQKKEHMIDKSKHRILKSAHPSGLSAARGFYGSKPFSKTNKFLKDLGKEPIDWQIPTNIP